MQVGLPDSENEQRHKAGKVEHPRCKHRNKKQWLYVTRYEIGEP